jgi:hypothetical protein
MATIQQAIEHYKYGISHDIFSEPVTSYAKLSIDALEKQIPKKPIHIHEVYPKHDWKLDKNGEIDTSAWGCGFCNGPICARCFHSECEHCNPKWETEPYEPCVVDEDICPNCNKEIAVVGNFCINCGQALDWSE